MQSPKDFLRNEFESRRAVNPNFSLRAFARWLCVSPAQLSQMMTGKRPITFKSMRKIGKRLGLSPIEQDALLNSVLKQKSSENVTAPKKRIQMQEDQFRIIADWYHFAILSLTKLKEAKPDPRWIAHKLGISFEEAHQALLRLERMRIIEISPNFRQISEPIEVVSTVPSEAIRKYHKQNLHLAIEKMETVPVQMREFQSISISLNPRHVSLFKKHIDDFLEIMAGLSEQQTGSEIYNLNVQLFPITIMKEMKK